MSRLPAPDAEALAHSNRLRIEIAKEINKAGGWIDFARYMELALYKPGMGYYSAGAHKFGAAGDFVTAPEITPVFAWTLASQIQQILETSAPRILEVGAGSGKLAADLLTEMERRDALPEHYFILELSADLRARQKTMVERSVPHLANRVTWLDALPTQFEGLVLANEVLDAMPVHLIAWQGQGLLERGVALDAAENFIWKDRPATGVLFDTARRLSVQGPYLSEVNLAATAWIAEWGRRLTHGALLLIDYGFPRHEFYHPQRDQGTLMCHYRHHAHADPFYLPGLNDITTHVDFTAVAEAAYEAGLSVLGYASQSDFLLNCGLGDVMTRISPEAPAYLKLAAGAQKLISPSEMGELFKVLALGRGIPIALGGFCRADRRHAL